MLETRVRVFLNPWSDTVPNGQLFQIVQMVADKRAEHIERQFQAGEYERDSFGLVILDPTAPVSRPSSETLLAAIEIGPNGEHCLPNGIAKAVWHRDHGQPAGYGVYVDLTTSADGDFCWGFSTQVDNTIGGGSGQNELQDACEVGHALVTFNFLVRQARKAWFDERAKADARPSWFCNQNEPAVLYTEMARQAHVIADSKFDVETKVS